jgi:hypothetical protein
MPHLIKFLVSGSHYVITSPPRVRLVSEMFNSWWGEVLNRMPLFITSKSQKEAMPIIPHDDLTLKLLPKAKVAIEKRKQTKPLAFVSLKK